jgi:hypothetical protein
MLLPVAASTADTSAWQVFRRSRVATHHRDVLVSIGIGARERRAVLGVATQMANGPCRRTREHGSAPIATILTRSFFVVEAVSRRLREPECGRSLQL